MLMRDVKEGKEKQARSNKQLARKQHSTPKAVTFPKKNELPRVGLEPTILYTLDRALSLPVQQCGECTQLRCRGMFSPRCSAPPQLPSTGSHDLPSDSLATITAPHVLRHNHGVCGLPPQEWLLTERFHFS